jgi:uncharacterized protein YbcV (DUF1398 family)
LDIEIIIEAARATQDGSLPFPQILSKLLAASVEYYHVDYVAMRTTFYSATGNFVAIPIPYENLPPVAAYFNLEKLRAAIFDSQHRGQKHQDFSHQVMQAGVQGYFAFLRGQRVTYWGRGGDHHTEWFPVIQTVNSNEQS